METISQTFHGESHFPSPYLSGLEELSLTLSPRWHETQSWAIKALYHSGHGDVHVSVILLVEPMRPNLRLSVEFGETETLFSWDLKLVEWKHIAHRDQKLLQSCGERWSEREANAYKTTSKKWEELESWQHNVSCWIQPNLKFMSGSFVSLNQWVMSRNFVTVTYFSRTESLQDNERHESDSLLSRTKK